MPTEAQLHVSGSARLAMVLAATGGFVDAFIYVRVTPVFVANMSGNLIRLGIASGGKNWISAASSAVALAGFWSEFSSRRHISTCDCVPAADQCRLRC